MSSVRRAHTLLSADDHLLLPSPAHPTTLQFHPSMSSPLHSVPLEVLERILRLAFQPTDPPSFTPAPSPPRGTSHLLLVSRGVRELCLPHFWRTVSIVQPNDWVALFDEQAGLLCAGEDGRRRWEWVDELSVFESAVLPVKIEAIDIEADPYINLLHPLELPTFRRLPRLLLDCNLVAPSVRLERAVAVEKEREKALGQLIIAPYLLAELDDLESWCKDDPETVKEAVDRIHETAWSDWEWDILCRARTQHCDRLLSAFQPVHLQQSARGIHRHYEAVHSGPLTGVEKPDLIEISGDDRSQEDLDGEDFRELLDDVQCTWPRAKCRLLRYSKKSLEVAERMISESLPAWWDSSWSWTRADGSAFTIDFATKNEA